MKWLFNPRLHRDAGAKGEGGSNEEIEVKEGGELEALQKMADQLKKFNTLMGEKADAEAFKKAEDEITTLKAGLEEMTSKQVLKAMESINVKNEAIWKQLVELQEKAAAGQEGGNSPTARKELINTKAIADFIGQTFEGETKTNKAAKIEIKAAETFGYFQTFVGGEGGATDITAFTGRLVDPELYQRRRKRNIILDYFNIRTINVPTLIYLEKVEVGDTNPTSGDPGGAAWILSGQAKPKRSFRVTTGEVTAKKVAIFGTIEDKLLRDVPSFENWIREDFMAEMRETINDGLLNNDPAINALAPLGLKTNATQYAVTPAFTLNVENANFIDALIAAFASMANRKERPSVAFVAEDVWYRLHNLKSTDGKWLNNDLIYVNRLGQLFIAGVEIVPVDNEDIPSTHFLLIGAENGFKIYAYGNMVFERGLNGEDFREDKTSFRGYQEFLSYIPSDRENSVMYDTFANVLAAISKPVV